MNRLLGFIDSKPGVAIFTALCVLLSTYAKEFVDSRLTSRVNPVVEQLSAIREELVRMREEQKSLVKILELQEHRLSRLEDGRIR